MLLRPYQTSAVEDLRDGYRQGHRRQLLVSPTGSGKTQIFSFVTKGALEKGLRVLILAHRSEILDQISLALLRFQVPHVMLTAGRRIPKNYRVMVASIQTLVRQLEGSPEPDLLVIDEAHRSAAQTWVTVFAQYNRSRILGVTATPERLDGKGLGDFFDRMVLGPSTPWLITNGFLARPIHYAPELVDTSCLRKTAGDYNKGDAAALMDKPTITGSAVEHYRRICPGKRAVAFCVSIEHAEHVAAEFRAAGIPSESVDGKMSKEERKAVFKRFEEGETSVLTSCELVSEGVDIPTVTAAIMLRPTSSLAMYLQCVGRALRPKPDGGPAIILDHVGNWMRHGRVEEEREWTLDGQSAKKRPKEVVIATKQCESCFAVFTTPACPQCGTVREIQSREIEQKAGTLKVLTEADIEAIRNKHQEEHECQSLGDFIALGKKRGYAAGWSWYRWNNSAQKKRQEHEKAKVEAQSMAPVLRGVLA